MIHVVIGLGITNQLMIYFIIGLGITNQRETTIIWDRSTGQPLYNAIGKLTFVFFFVVVCCLLLLLLLLLL
jgi:hypothetical protein